MTCLEASIRQLAHGWIQYNPVRTFVLSLRGLSSVLMHSVCLDTAQRVHVLHTAHVQHKATVLQTTQLREHPRIKYTASADKFIKHNSVLDSCYLCFSYTRHHMCFSTFCESYIVIPRIRSVSKVFKCFSIINPCYSWTSNFNEQLRSYPLCTLKPEAVRTVRNIGCTLTPIQLLLDFFAAEDESQKIFKK